jgi:hypothetical protein
MIKSTRTQRVGMLAGAALLLVACGQANRDSDEDLMMDSAANASMATAAAPDTTADAVWAHLQERQFASTWAMWPGKTSLYPGNEPHGMLLTTYVNSLGVDAITNGATAMPVGTIIVKENYRPDSTLAATTVMYKVAGYNAEHGDWFWMKRLANGEVEAAGRVATCQSCHAQSTTDFIMTQTLGTAPKPMQ